MSEEEIGKGIDLTPEKVYVKIDVTPKEAYEMGEKVGMEEGKASCVGCLAVPPIAFGTGLTWGVVAILANELVLRKVAPELAPSASSAGLIGLVGGALAGTKTGFQVREAVTKAGQILAEIKEERRARRNQR